VKGPAWIGLLFIGLAVVFISITVSDLLKTSGRVSIARKVWIRMAFIFAAVGIGLNLIQMIFW